MGYENNDKKFLHILANFGFFPSMLTTSYAGKQSNEAYHRFKRITPLKYSPIIRKLLDYEIKHDA